MNNIIKLFASTILLFGYSTCQEASFKYRPGYVLLNDAFYKYHNTYSNWHEAKQICEDEATTLFYPQNEIEKVILRDMLLNSNLHFTTNTFLHVGVFDANGTGNVRTVDNDRFTQPLDNSDAKEGLQMCMVMTYPDMKIIGHTCNTYEHFICKIEQTEIRWNKECKIAFTTKDKNNYEYNSTLKSCYKLHKVPRTWKEANKICRVEQAMLAELNSVEEVEHMKGIVTRVPEEEVGVVCLGFNLKNDGWKTLSGQHLRDSGYALWAHTQPDGGGAEAYGAMAYNARLHDISAQAACIFVCELQVEQ